MRQLTIAIDYDGTITADPTAFYQVMAELAFAGHRVVICTGRAFPPTETPPGLPVYCTAGQAKAEYMREQGVRVDIWIDDDPGSILQSDDRT